jgi:hypothetical protein
MLRPESKVINKPFLKTFLNAENDKQGIWDLSYLCETQKKKSLHAVTNED